MEYKKESTIVRRGEAGVSMNFRQATLNYERWMRQCTPIIESELRDKHSMMRQDAFQFLRGSYYRWAQLWPQICPEPRSVPVVLCVGDLHVDSYGTWRDAEGRMSWGVDDFDEAWPLPYTNDLIRLAASVKVAKSVGILSIKMKTACEIISEAYKLALKEGGCPIVLAEEEAGLEKLGIAALKPAKSFWTKLNNLPAVRGRIPSSVSNAFRKTLPTPTPKYRIVRREAGLGSLGQLRFVAIADYRGGCIGREAKNVVPSANMWLRGDTSRFQSYYEETMNSAFRSLDPYQKIIGSWLIRRLSPDSNPIKIEELGKKRDEEILLKAMGTETANVHLGTCNRARAILNDLRSRKPEWLHSGAKKMAKLCLREWKEYKA